VKFNTKLLGVIDNIKEHEEDSDTLIIEGFANTVTKDRAGDVIPKSAWEMPSALSNYLKNPIILAYHDHRQPIGKMVEQEVTDMGLRIKASISKSAGAVYGLIKEGILTTFSVGFNILDAEYDSPTDTYFIKAVELFEISVVSVPCNQDSVFSVSKGMDSQDFEQFKIKHAPEGDIKEKQMTLEEMKALAAQMKADTAEQINVGIKTALTEAEAAKTAAAVAKAASDKAASEKAESIKTSATEAAKALIADLEVTLGKKDDQFAEMVKANHDQIVALKEEIAQVVAQRNNPAMTPIARGISGLSHEKQFAEDADTLMFVSTIKKVGMFESDFGKNIKAVNTSSNIEVSSEGYETTFATNLARDIQAALVVAPLFTEINMTSASLTIPINPNKTAATWVGAAETSGGTRTNATTGAEVDVALTEKTLKTFKLAAKVYLTEESEEDAIISLVPILRMHLVEAHAKAIDGAFLIGTGAAGIPRGLVTQAEAVAGQNFPTLAKSDKSVLVTAAEILSARRGLGLYGINLSDLYIVISQDAYWDLIQDTEWSDVQQVGEANATKLVGEVGNVYGMRVLVSNEFAARAPGSVYAILVNASNFMVTRQRGVTVRSDFDVEKDRTVFVATQRLNLETMIEASPGNGKGVVSIKFAA
jgi:HK97 family phage prohead protease/HK97 family phage major capsid protein